MALPRGGRILEEYPIDSKNYLEGILKEGWEKKKVENPKLENFEDVSTFVSIVFFTLLNISYLLYTDISASQWVP